MAFFPKGYGSGYGVGSDTTGSYPNVNASGDNTADPNSDSNFQNIMSILGRGLGTGLSAYGQGQQFAADRLAAANQFAANMGENQLTSDRNYQLAQANSANAANPLGAEQNFAQKQKLAQILLGGARNFSVRPGDPAVAAAMGQRSGGLQLPSGGIDPSVINSLFGDAATQASIAQREKQVGQINPNAPTYDLSSMYGNSTNGSPNAYMTDIQNAKAQALNAQNTAQARQRQIIQNAIDGNIAAAKSSKHSGLMGLLGSLGGAAISALPGLLAL